MGVCDIMIINHDERKEVDNELIELVYAIK